GGGGAGGGGGGGAGGGDGGEGGGGGGEAETGAGAGGGEGGVAGGDELGRAATRRVRGRGAGCRTRDTALVLRLPLARRSRVFTLAAVMSGRVATMRRSEGESASVPGFSDGVLPAARSHA